VDLLGDKAGIGSNIVIAITQNSIRAAKRDDDLVALLVRPRKEAFAYGLVRKRGMAYPPGSGGASRRPSTA
jgi:hypothetical protein